MLPVSRQGPEHPASTGSLAYFSNLRPHWTTASRHAASTPAALHPAGSGPALLGHLSHQATTERKAILEPTVTKSAALASALAGNAAKCSFLDGLEPATACCCHLLGHFGKPGGH